MGLRFRTEFSITGSAWERWVFHSEAGSEEMAEMMVDLRREIWPYYWWRIVDTENNTIIVYHPYGDRHIKSNWIREGF